MASTHRMTCRPARHVATAALVILMLSLGAAMAEAQSASGGRHRIALTLGRASVDERDESASPLRYHGSGFATALDYGLETARWRFDAGITHRSAGLEPDRKSTFGNPSSASHETIGASIALARRFMRFRNDRGRLFAGLAVDASVTNRDQHFPTVGEPDYLHAILSFAPTVRVELDRGAAATVTYSIAAPLLTGVVRSYSSNHQYADPAARSIEWGSAGSRRIVLQRLVWTRALGRRAGFRASYAVELFDLHGDELFPRIAGQRSQLAASLIWWTQRSP